MTAMQVSARSPEAARSRDWIILIGFWLTALALAFAMMFVGWGGGHLAKLHEAIVVHDIPSHSDYLHVWPVIEAAPEAIGGLVYVLAQPWTPTMAAFIVCAIAFGFAGVRHLAGRYRPWDASVSASRGALVWGVCFATMLAISLASAGLQQAFVAAYAPGASFTWSPPQFLSLSFVSLLVGTLFLDGGGLAEEGGWRGFATPFAQRFLSPVAASVLIGVLWSAWHLPAKEDITFGGVEAFATYFTPFTIRLVFFSIVMTYFSNSVGGSALIAVMMHGMHNDSIGFQGGVEGLSESAAFALNMLLILPWAITACALIAMTKGRLGINDAALWRVS